jgi:antitoxin ParD1/3/4
MLREVIMQKSTSFVLGEHFDGFIAKEIREGRYSSASEVIRAGLRLLEEREQKIALLQAALNEGEESGESDRTLKEIAQELKQQLRNEL